MVSTDYVFPRVSLLGSCAGDTMARARAMCELFFSCAQWLSLPCHQGQEPGLVPRSWKQKPWMLPQSVLFCPCLHSLCSHQLYLCLGGSNAGTGGFLWARHTLRLSRKPVRYTDSSWPTTSTSPSTGLTHLIQIQYWVQICCIPSSVHSTWQQTLKPDQFPSFPTWLWIIFTALVLDIVLSPVFFSLKGLHIDVFLICSWGEVSSRSYFTCFPLNVTFSECAGIFRNFKLEWNDFHTVIVGIMIISECPCLLSFLIGLLSKDPLCDPEEKIEARQDGSWVFEGLFSGKKTGHPYTEWATACTTWKHFLLVRPMYTAS